MPQPGRFSPSTILALLPVLLAAALAAVEAGSTGPTLWVQSSFADFLAGDLDSVSLTATGSIRLAPALELLHDTETPYVWAVAHGDDGTIYYAVGSEGDVYRLPPGGEPERFFSLSGNVHAMVFGADGHLYTTSTPGGFVHRVAADAAPLAGSEAPAAWYEPRQRYAWALATDSRGRLFVGTGPEGIIQVVDADANGETLYDSAQSHITALAVDPDDNVIAGTEDGGHVYRISPEGDVFVLFDSPLREITGIVPAESGVFVAGIGTGAASDDVRPSGPSTLVEAQAASSGTPSTGASSASADDLAGAVYLIHRDGFTETLWTSTEESVFAMTAFGRGVVVGTGPGGHLLEVDAEGEVTVLQRIEAGQITALQSIEGDQERRELLVATSNLGRLYRLGSSHRDRGELVSQVKDTGTTSRWGRVRWWADTPSGTSVSLYTRTGNTESPDNTWSDWAGPYTDASGSAIINERARFIQWKAELQTDDASRTPILERVEAVYIQRNLRPEIEEFVVHPSGVLYRPTTNIEDNLPFAQLPPSTEAELARRQGRDSGAGGGAPSSFLGRPYYVRGQQTFTWRAQDANGDRLSYTLAYRGEDEAAWKTIAAGLTESMYTWDTNTVPDGYYVARVVASDAPSNPEGDELEGRESSSVFTIDNTPPQVTQLAAVADGERLRVTGSVSDVVSLIYQLEYAIDGGEWRSVLPGDGLADSSRETIEFLIAAPGPGEHTIVVRATDTALNYGAAKLVVGR